MKIKKGAGHPWANLHELFNDNNEEAKLLAFQLEALNNHFIL